jgi:predicted DNA-binding transcriptional regulator AlpA
MVEDLEFWPLKVVVKKVGLSKTEIYRRIAEGRFPQSRSYRKFWLSTEIREWQQALIAPPEEHRR